jgi:cupin fold WbuC family metalloprotein
VLAMNSMTMIDDKQIQQICEEAYKNDNRTARQLLHTDHSQKVQEMLIAQVRGSWNKPNQAPGKSESLIILKGTMKLVLLDDTGLLKSQHIMGPIGSNHPFHYRMENVNWHFMLPISDELVVLEFISGPFVAEEPTSIPSWVPNSKMEFVKYIDHLGITNERM